MSVVRGEGRGNGRKKKKKKKKKSSYPIARSPRSPENFAFSNYGHIRDRRASFFFFLLIFRTEALDPLAFGGSIIISSGSISFAFPFKILVSKLFISLTCNIRASIDDWQEY